jgi:hypothetical protein
LLLYPTSGDWQSTGPGFTKAHGVQNVDVSVCVEPLPYGVMLHTPVDVGQEAGAAKAP